MLQYSKVGSKTERLQGLAGKGVLMKGCLHVHIACELFTKQVTVFRGTELFFPMAGFSEGLLISFLRCSLISGIIQREIF